MDRCDTADAVAAGLGELGVKVHHGEQVLDEGLGFLRVWHICSAGVACRQGAARPRRFC